MRLARLLRRWEVSPERQASLSFEDGILLLNLRRTELAALLLVVNDALELAFGRRIVATQIELTGALFFLFASAGLSATRSRILRRAVPIAFILLASATTQIAVAHLSGGDRVTSGFPIRMLCLTLLFVLPPRALATLFVITFASYAGMILLLPLASPVRISALVAAAIVAAICQMAGSLIYTARRSGFQQRRLIEYQNEQLAAKNAELDQLMAVTAHDLRSPLYGLRNLFDLAIRRAPGDPDLPIRTMRDGIGSIDGMLALVTRLLDAHRAEHAPLADTVRADLRDPVASAAGRAKALAEACGIVIVITLPPAAAIAAFEPGALGQILDNLLANAVRFGPAGSTIGLVLSVNRESALVSVIDGGHGVDPALHASLFDKFSRSGGKAGAGMGLFIAATYATRIGATLGHRPNRPHGAIFEVTIPLADRP